MKVYHSGDTAYFEGFTEMGRRLKPDVALLPIGAYFPDSYRAVHTSPEEAVRGFVETGAEWMVPMHFGTFRLGREPMEEPVMRLMAEARGWGLQITCECWKKERRCDCQDLQRLLRTRLHRRGAWLRLRK